MKDVEEKLRDSANGIAPPTTTAQVALCRIKVKEKEKKQEEQENPEIGDKPEGSNV